MNLHRKNNKFFKMSVLEYVYRKKFNKKEFFDDKSYQSHFISNLNNETAIEELVSSMSKLHKESYLKTIEASMSTFHDHIFSKIDVPTLILVGEKDTLTPPSMALEIHKLIKNSKFSIIEEAGHLINIENPKAFNYEILKFLKDLRSVL